MKPTTLEAYEHFVYNLREIFPSIQSSTLRIIRTGPDSERLVGIVTFPHNIHLDVAELVDFDAGYFEILQYGYVVWQHDERLYWYDSQEHPHDSTLASTHPHHKHIPPDIKHHRIPAPGLSFTEPNLIFLIREVEQLLST
ncbi:MAG: hypothetical protein JXA33_25745 [Anaerolineae bacterium]|nr:hypothetical protein [Anaerolineae bacterium]